MDPQAQRPVNFFAMVTDKRKAEKAKACRRKRREFWGSGRRGDLVSAARRNEVCSGSTINSQSEQS